MQSQEDKLKAHAEELISKYEEAEQAKAKAEIEFSKIKDEILTFMEEEVKTKKIFVGDHYITKAERKTVKFDPSKIRGKLESDEELKPLVKKLFRQQLIIEVGEGTVLDRILKYINRNIAKSDVDIEVFRSERFSDKTLEGLISEGTLTRKFLRGTFTTSVSKWPKVGSPKKADVSPEEMLIL